VYSTRGSFAKVTRLCNWRFEIVYYDVNNRAYSTLLGPLNTTCNESGSFQKNYSPTTVREGLACTKLYASNGRYVSQRCVRISR
jgi:hypothetical protein